MKVVHAQALASVRDGQVRSAGRMGPLAMSLDLSKVPPRKKSTLLLLLCVFLIVIFSTLSMFLYSFRNWVDSGKWPTWKLPYKMMVFCFLLNYTAPPYKAPTAFESMGDLSYTADR